MNLNEKVPAEQMVQLNQLGAINASISELQDRSTELRKSFIETFAQFNKGDIVTLKGVRYLIRGVDMSDTSGVYYRIRPFTKKGVPYSHGGRDSFTYQIDNLLSPLPDEKESPV